VTTEVARRAGEYARLYPRSHGRIGVVDYLLAGTASAVSAELLTTNVRHFPMFADLRAPDGYWAAPTTSGRTLKNHRACAVTVSPEPFLLLPP
jgi:hypothetical protein